MSHILPHLKHGYAVDQAIMYEEDRLVCIRFGHSYDAECMIMDEMLSEIAPKVRKYCVVYVVDIAEVPDFNVMYELYDPYCIMFFYRNKHIQVDMSTGDNNKINFLLSSEQELIDILEATFVGYGYIDYRYS
ncbi:Dim1 family protein [Kipferlia bialata]|uniref:Dim1 family protein n=1 Tax=Kipferlia bialata TaxID=797122 RepID=A0A9K3CU69_9EUKA|nr:Dim1 family protein [Kipferlia bialata]|eukprot:g2655.t1